MEFKDFVICYTLLGFCQDIFCIQVNPEGCETSAPPKELLEIVNNGVRPKTDKKRIVLAAPAINNYDKSGKINKKMPPVALKVLKPTAARNRDLNEPSRATKVTSPIISHVDETHINPSSTDKTVDDHDIKERELRDYVVNLRVNKTSDVIHDSVGYVETDQNDGSTLEVLKLDSFKPTNNLGTSMKLNDVHPDIANTNPKDFHKQVRTRSLEDKTGNIYEEDDPVISKVVHPVITPDKQFPELMPIDEQNKPVVDIQKNRRIGLNDIASELEGIGLFDKASKVGVQTAEMKQNNAQTADFNKTTTDSPLPSSLIKRTFEAEKEPAVKQIKRENENFIRSNDMLQTDDQNRYLQPTTNFHTNYKSTESTISPHYHELTNFEDPQQHYWKYHLFPVSIHQSQPYASSVDYNRQAETQPYQYVPVYDSPSRWYDPENLAFYGSNLINSNQVTGYPPFNQINSNEIIGYPQCYNPFNSNHLTGYPQYYNTIDSNQVTGYQQYDPIVSNQLTGYPYYNSFTSNEITGYPQYKNPINSNQVTGYPQYNLINSNQVTGYSQYNPINSNQVTDYAQCNPVNSNQVIDYAHYGSGNDAYGNPLNYYNTFKEPTYYVTTNANPYQTQPDSINVSPQSDFNPYKPDFSETLPPLEYPFEKQLSDLYFNVENNDNTISNSRPVVWRIPNCNHYYNWFRKQCRIKPKPYFWPNKYYYGIPNKYTAYPDLRKSKKRQILDGYYITPYQIQSNRNLYSLQNKKTNNRRSTFPKYYEVTSKL